MAQITCQIKIVFVDHLMMMSLVVYTSYTKATNAVPHHPIYHVCSQVP